jgi:glycosyltransferase involved in cell wall biosynthesis
MNAGAEPNGAAGRANGSVLSAPAVSVGLPVYNGGSALRRAIESVLSQSLPDVELVISDNASLDDTAAVCEEYARVDRRVRYFRQPENIGVTRNFGFVLQRATAPLFMWLGHDDWLDKEYLRRCVEVTRADPAVTLVCGVSRYYEGGEFRHAGHALSAADEDRYLRVIRFFREVMDNGSFYGVMRRDMLLGITIPTVLGADWIMIASVAFLGKIITVEDVTVHRALGGLTRSYAQIVEAGGFPQWNARYPKAAIALAALDYIGRGEGVFAKLPLPARAALGAGAGLAVLEDSGIYYLRASVDRVRRVPSILRRHLGRPAPTQPHRG